eukprot:355098-Chlamydomonas_euryale.AAC.2
MYAGDSAAVNRTFSGMHSSDIWGCREEGCGGGTNFRDLLKLNGCIELVPWPEISSGGGMCLREAVGRYQRPC